MSVETKQSIIKIGAIYTLSNLVVRGIAFLTTPIFTRLMSQSDFGEFSNIASWANILSVVITLSLHSSINRAKYDYDDEMQEYLSGICVLGSLFTLACWGIVELNIDWFEKFFAMDRIYIRSLMIFCMFSPAVQALMAKHRMYNEYRRVIALTWITLLVSTFSSVLLVVLLPDKLFGRVIGNYVIVTFVNFALWLYVLLKGRSTKIEHCKYAIALSVPLIPHELAGILLTISDRIIINQLCGAKDAALYTVAYTIATIITVLLSSLNQAWVPWFYDHLDAHDYQSIKKVVKGYTALFSYICVGLMLIGPELVMIFGGKAYMSAVSVIPPVCFAIELQFVYTLYVNIEFFNKKSILISIATVIATAANIALNYAFIPLFGYVAAAYTTIAGYLLMAIFHYIASRCISNCEEYFNSRVMIINIIYCAIGVGITLLLYGHNRIRLIFVVVYVAFIVIAGLKNKEQVLALIRGKIGV